MGVKIDSKNDDDDSDGRKIHEDVCWKEWLVVFGETDIFGDNRWEQLLQPSWIEISFVLSSVIVNTYEVQYIAWSLIVKHCSAALWPLTSTVFVAWCPCLHRCKIAKYDAHEALAKSPAASVGSLPSLIVQVSASSLADVTEHWQTGTTEMNADYRQTGPIPSVNTQQLSQYDTSYGTPQVYRYWLPTTFLSLALTWPARCIADWVSKKVISQKWRWVSI